MTALPNGLVVVWLEEPGAAALHLRLALGDAPDTGAAARAVATAWLDRRIRLRTRDRDVEYELSRAPGRIELAVHATDADANRWLTRLAGAFAGNASPGAVTREWSAALTGARDATSAVAPDVQALARLAALARGEPTPYRWASEADFDALAAAPEQAATALDPSRSVLVVHASSPATASRETLAALAEAWPRPAPQRPRGRTRSAGGREPDATLVSLTARVQLSTPAPAGTATAGATLGGPAPAPVHAWPDVGGPPTAWLVRSVPLASVEERAMGRLATRLLQEQHDVRWLAAGAHALFVWRAPLDPADPAQALLAARDRLQAAARARVPRQRLRRAAVLWLGARLVGASLADEDWTALWLDATDAATADEQIPSALAVEAATMLASEPEPLRAFMAATLDPTAATGWTWAVTGLDAAAIERLGRSLPLARAE